MSDVLEQHVLQIEAENTRLHAKIERLKDRIDAYETDAREAETDIKCYKAENVGLLQQIKDLEWKNDQLLTQIDEMRKLEEFAMSRKERNHGRC